MDGLTLLLALCTPNVHPITAQAIVMHESGGNPFAIGINGRQLQLSQQPASKMQAVAAAKMLIAGGYSIDMGYAQINAANLPRLKMTVEDAFDPCLNLKAMQTILSEGYQRATAIHGEGQRALQAALSSYNTGNNTAGLSNGYVRAVYGRTGK